MGAVLVCALFVGSIFVGTSAKPKPAGPGYHLLKTVSLPPGPGTGEYFDYITVDADARRVYITHGSEVVVLNADDYRVVGKIGPFERCQGVGYVTDEGPKKVFVFDPKTLKITGNIDVKYDVDSLIYEPVSKHIFTMNAADKNTTVIDPVKDAVITSIDLG